MNAIQERRFRILHIGQDELLGLLRRIRELDRSPAPSYFMTAEGLPELPADVVVDAVHYDPCYRGFAVLLASAEFEPVPAGMEIPGLERDMCRAGLSVDAAEVRALATPNFDLQAMTTAPENSWVHTKKTVTTEDILRASEQLMALPRPTPEPPPEVKEIIDRYMSNGALTAADVTTLREWHYDADPSYGTRARKVSALETMRKIVDGGEISLAMHAEPKSEARLALEYDLRQALAPMEGPAILDAITSGPDLLLSDALRRARGGDKQDAARYLLTVE